MRAPSPPRVPPTMANSAEAFSIDVTEKIATSSTGAVVEGSEPRPVIIRDKEPLQQHTLFLGLATILILAAVLGTGAFLKDAIDQRAVASIAATAASPSPLACAMAGVQAPRDLTSTNDGSGNPVYAAGLRNSKMATLSSAESSQLELTNVHFHLGAEHKSNFFKDTTATTAWSATTGRRSPSSDKAPRPGFMCAPADNGWNLTASQLTAYSFKYCEGIAVGKTFELHYVHSSAGHSGGSWNDGLGVAAGFSERSIRNPMIVVNALVVHVINDASDASSTYGNMEQGWDIVNGNGVPVLHNVSGNVMYQVPPRVRALATRSARRTKSPGMLTRGAISFPLSHSTGCARPWRPRAFRMT